MGAAGSRSSGTSGANSSHSQVAAALTELGLEPDASWDDIRQAYRELVRSSHPDLARTDNRATERTARINVAFTVLADVTDQGRRPLPSPDPPPAPPRPAPAPVTLRTPPGDVFVQFLEAAYEVGDVSYMDPEAGLIQILLDHGDPCAAQLLIAIDTEAEPPTASFTLDAADAAHAPPIRHVVDQLADAMANPRPLE